MKLSREPVTVNKDTWYYESARGIQVICWKDRPMPKVADFVIPWKLLAASLRRYRAKPTPKRKARK